MNLVRRHPLSKPKSSRNQNSSLLSGVLYCNGLVIYYIPAPDICHSEYCPTSYCGLCLYDKDSSYNSTMTRIICARSCRRAWNISVIGKYCFTRSLKGLPTWFKERVLLSFWYWIEQSRSRVHANDDVLFGARPAVLIYYTLPMFVVCQVCLGLCLLFYV